MSSASNNIPVPTSVDYAISFLVHPLIESQTPLMIFHLRDTLEIALRSHFDPSTDSKLTLTLSPHTLPPHPIFSACLVTGIFWVEWIRLLGGRTFDLILEPRALTLIYHGDKPQVEVLWSEHASSQAMRAPLVPTLNEIHVPINKLVQRSTRPNLFATVQSAVARSQARKSLELLQTKQEEEEADTLLAMISNCTLATPSPTSDEFLIAPPRLIIPANIFPSPLSSPESESPLSTRPNSRSSGFSSFSSDNENRKSLSSIPSCDSLGSSTLPPMAVKLLNEQVSLFEPRKQSEPKVFIDNQKKDVTKYLYQGGVSTVLTGGVMLGGPSAATCAKPVQAAKYRAPIGGKKFSGFKNAASSADSWRRSPRA